MQKAERINLILSRITLRKMQQRQQPIVTGYKKDKPEERRRIKVIDERNALMEGACIVSAVALLLAGVAVVIAGM